MLICSTFMYKTSVLARFVSASEWKYLQFIKQKLMCLKTSIILIYST